MCMTLHTIYIWCSVSRICKNSQRPRSMNSYPSNSYEGCKHLSVSWISSKLWLEPLFREANVWKQIWQQNCQILQVACMRIEHLLSTARQFQEPSSKNPWAAARKIAKKIETNQRKESICGSKKSPVIILFLEGLCRVIRVNAILTCAHVPQHHKWKLQEHTTGVHKLSILVIDVHKYNNA